MQEINFMIYLFRISLMLFRQRVNDHPATDCRYRRVAPDDKPVSCHCNNGRLKDYLCRSLSSRFHVFTVQEYYPADDFIRSHMKPHQVPVLQSPIVI